MSTNFVTIIALCIGLACREFNSRQCYSAGNLLTRAKHKCIIHVHHFNCHRYYYHSAWKPILILPSHDKQKAELTSRGNWKCTIWKFSTKKLQGVENAGLENKAQKAGCANAGQENAAQKICRAGKCERSQCEKRTDTNSIKAIMMYWKN